MTDTVGRGFRFNPDPLTTANTVYGGSFVGCLQDLNQSLLDSYRDSVELELTFHRRAVYLSFQCCTYCRI